jgi:2-hydroxychromene-2-carboxylate isomerase
MPAPTIRFLFDFISPYAYLAWTQIHALAERAGAVVEPEPVLFAALLNAHGQKGPAEIPAKRLYLFKDVLRRAARFGVPIAAPPTHPFNPLLSLRAASLPLPAPERRRLIDGLYAATWGGGGGVEGPDEVAAVAAAAGLDGAAVVQGAQGPEAKARLRAQTDAALAAGVFGVPTMIVGDELFWGTETLQDVEAHLRGEDPVQRAGAAALERWAAITASARRI